MPSTLVSLQSGMSNGSHPKCLLAATIAVEAFTPMRELLEVPPTQMPGFEAIHGRTKGGQNDSLPWCPCKRQQIKPSLSAVVLAMNTNLAKTSSSTCMSEIISNQLCCRVRMLALWRPPSPLRPVQHCLGLYQDTQDALQMSRR
jgi:hypothetical protein